MDTGHDINMVEAKRVERLRTQLVQLRALQGTSHIINTQADREIVGHMIRTIEIMLGDELTPQQARHHA